MENNICNMVAYLSFVQIVSRAERFAVICAKAGGNTPSDRLAWYQRQRRAYEELAKKPWLEK